MPQIRTESFGEIEFAESAVFRFPLGLPAFEDEREFVFVERPGTAPLLFMQSVTSHTLCFILLPILAVDPEYQLVLEEDQVAILGLSSTRPRIGEDVLCAAIVRAARRPDEVPTANLLAPLVVNFRNGLGVQVIQPGTRYSHCHPLLKTEELAPCS